MQFPLIKDFITCKDYFQNFYKLNNSEDEKLSFRILAKKLDWPFSYLSDLMHGRKPLTITRALEFSQFAAFSLVETERLLYMCLSDSKNNEVKNFFINKLELGHNYKIDIELEEFQKENEKISNDIFSGVLLKYLIWCNGKTNKEDVGKLLYVFPEFKDLSFLEEKIKLLAMNGNLEILLNSDSRLEVVVVKPNINSAHDIETVHNMNNFLDSMSRFICHKNVNGVFNFGFVNIKKENLKEATERISILRNWLIGIDKPFDTTQEQTNGSMLFQYSVCLALAIDKDESGINRLSEWIQK